MPDLARIDEICDGVVARIEANWPDKSAPDEVAAVDEVDIVTDPLEESYIGAARKVYVIADAYDNPEISARGSDFNTYTVMILIARLYTKDDSGTSLKDFVRAERRWVQESVYKPLTDIRGARLLKDDDNEGLLPVAPSLVEVPCDVEELRERKLFLSQVRVTYQEDARA